MRTGLAGRGQPMVASPVRVEGRSVVEGQPLDHAEAVQCESPKNKWAGNDDQV